MLGAYVWEPMPSPHFFPTTVYKVGRLFSLVLHELGFGETQVKAVTESRAGAQSWADSEVCAPNLHALVETGE